MNGGVFNIVKTEFIRARVDEALKINTEVLFSRLGLTMTEAITLFLKQCELHQGLPFEIRIPSNKKQLLAAIERKKIPIIELTLDGNGNAFIDKEKHPELYDWAVNG